MAGKRKSQDWNSSLSDFKCVPFLLPPHYPSSTYVPQFLCGKEANRGSPKPLHMHPESSGHVDAPFPSPQGIPRGTGGGTVGDFTFLYELLVIRVCLHVLAILVSGV